MSLSLSQLATHAGTVLEREPRQRVLAYAWAHPWVGGESIQVGERLLPLRYCTSSLEVREAMAQEYDSWQVLLVGVPENTLGRDVLARLVQQRLLHVDRWQLVQDAYGVRQVDPRLFSLPWMPTLLLDALPTWQPGVSPVLSHADAMANCLAWLFGLPTEQPGLGDLVATCESNASRWLAIPEDQRAVFRQHLVSRFGPLAAVFVTAMEHGTGHAIVATGLACEVLYSDQAARVQPLHDARIRLESRLGGHRLDAADGRRWAELAVSLVVQRDDTVRQNDERVAVDLLTDIGAAEHLHISSVLAAGLDARLVMLGDAIDRFLRAPDAVSEVEVAVATVLAHRSPPVGHPGPAAASMAVRLCRSLVAGDPADAGIGPVSRYIAHGAWQDWARRSLRGVRPDRFARAVTKLLDRVAESRRGEDEVFAKSLVSALRLGTLPAETTPVEAALDRVVAPLAAHAPLLMVVLDGMSVDVSLAIAESLGKRGWSAWARRGEPEALLATVPSVTEFSRSALLSGRVEPGVARQEVQRFKAHDTLRRVSREGRPPLLFHKAGVDLSHQLGPDVSEAIADPQNRVVAMVINAIDDTLAKSEQIRIDWTIETIPLLAEVLDQARQAGRAVILTSDHGHVLERDSRLVPGGVGERYRASTPAPGEGELFVSGARVKAAVGGDVVVPWREDIRYAGKKNGYHGGVSRQEMIVPLGIWTGVGLDLPDADYLPVTSDRPEWWDGSRVQAGTATHVQETKGGRRKAVPAQPAAGMPADLFAIPDDSDLAERLLASSTLAHQQGRVGRTALESGRLRALVGRLERGGGRASVEQLAGAIEMPTMRMRGVLSVLERTLNVDGFPVVTVEQATGTVLLDLALLRTQFQL